MTNTIAQAWADMVTNHPAAPTDIPELLRQPLHELVEATASEPLEPHQIENSTPIQLGYGFSIAYLQHSQANGLTRSIAAIERSGYPALHLGVQIGPWDRKLQVSVPPNDEFIPWTPENGPQKQWALRTLRQQIIDYISR